MTATFQALDIKTVATRPVKGRAIQLLYQESTEETLRYVRRMEACLGVRISCANDQGALFCHLELDSFRSPIISHGDWVLVDSFGKASIVKDADFKVYYEPE